MALLAWYKLNGDAKNYGTADLELSQVTAPTWATAGALGNYSLCQGAYNWSAIQAASVFNNDELSYAAWIYVNSTDSDNMIFGNNGDRTFALFQYPSRNDLHWSWKYNDSGNVAAGVREGVLPDGKWTHIAFSYKKGNVKFYINGAQVASESITYSRTNFSNVTNVFHNNPGRWMQDVRIYNHALTPREVFDIARGLSMHLTFGGNGYPGAGKNLCEMNVYSPETAYLGQYYTRLGYSESFYGLQAGDNYILRMKITAPADRGVMARIQFYTNDSTRTSVLGNTIAKGTTGYSIIKDTLTSAQRAYSRMEICISTADSSKTSSVGVDIGDLKLEHGDVPTAWIPCTNTSDMKLIKGSSGYCSELSYSGHEPTTDGGSPRYGACAKFANNQYIQYTLPGYRNETTWMCWVYYMATSGGYHSIDIAPNNPSQNLWLAINTERRGVWAYWSGVYNRGPTTTLAENTWHHIAFTWKNGLTRWYVDGSAVGSEVDFSSKSTTWPSGNRTLGNSYTGSNWNGTPLNCKISDWRLYNKCLSADEIKRIYSVPAAITSAFTVHAAGFVGGSNTTSVGRSGMLSSPALREYEYDMSELKIGKTGAFICKRILEDR